MEVDQGYVVSSYDYIHNLKEHGYAERSAWFECMLG
jgi:hypothetical protein